MLRIFLSGEIHKTEYTFLTKIYNEYNGENLTYYVYSEILETPQTTFQNFILVLSYLLLWKIVDFLFRVVFETLSDSGGVLKQEIWIFFSF